VSGEQLRAVFKDVLLAEYHCRYDWWDRKVKDIREGEFYPTRFASPQGTLIPLMPQDCVVGIALSGPDVGHRGCSPCSNCCSSRWCTPRKPNARGGVAAYPFSSRLTSFRKRQSVPWASIFWGLLLIIPTSCRRSA